MGLSISVFYLASMKELDEEGAAFVEQELDTINAVLTDQNLPTHAEPADAPKHNPRRGLWSFPYSTIHHLRRFQAHLHETGKPPSSPCAPGDNPASDPYVDDAASLFSSHLICHSDCEGYYVPVVFGEHSTPEIIFDDRVPGGMLGSSHHLLAELIELAPHLNISLDPDNNLSPEALAALTNFNDLDNDPWRLEKYAWLTLFECASLSVAHNTVIFFH